MVKPFVAPLAVLALLALAAVPAAADPEDPASQGPGDPSAEPAPSQEPTTQGNGTGDGSPGPGSGDGNSTSSGSATVSDPRVAGCPIARSNIGSESMGDWIVLDPNGCYNELIKRVIGIPPIRFAYSLHGL